VTGEVEPDCTGNYFLAGTFGGQPWYLHSSGNYSIWFVEGLDFWCISNAPGEYDFSWSGSGIDILGQYQPDPPNASGIATVASGPA
jgi:hypothetical protein